MAYLSRVEDIIPSPATSTGGWSSGWYGATSEHRGLFHGALAGIRVGVLRGETVQIWPIHNANGFHQLRSTSIMSC